MDILIQIVLVVVVICMLVWITLRQRRNNERIREINKTLPWLVIQRNVLCQSLWGTGIRGFAHQILFSNNLENPEIRVAVFVTESAVTISSPGQEEFVMRMKPPE